MRRPRTGTEPVTARSPVRLRLIMASAALVVFAAATAGLVIWAASAGPNTYPGRNALLVLAVVCGILALLAAVDLVVLARRHRRGEDADA
ncbi:DUF6343 family protein [Streptomyces sp. NPDC001793]|uniref:DUF6343 family protein n=1 Tax=Streptomyces sp. NPDC001793 TaxID=3154657 RepID=UPI00332FAFC7